MQHTDAVRLIRRTFENAYDETNLRTLVAELFHGAENKDKVYSGAYIPAAYRDHISSYKYICKYISPDQEELAVLAVNCSKVESLEKARTLQRNFVANYMKERGKDACLVAFYSDEDRSHWRFSFVRIDNSFNFDTLKTQDIITPAKRFSYMVGEKEASHTAQQQLCMLLEDNGKRHTIDEIESAFAIEKISDQFFMDYKLKFIELVEYMEQLRKTNTNLNSHFVLLNISNELFCKKLLGQIVFLYFLQKKGWLGVSLDKQWGDGDKRFLANLFLQADSKGLNYFNECLEPLFYEALAEERKDHVYKPLGCKIPFLNGGLFDPVGKYDWKHTIISIPNEIFKNGRDGILDIFDRYNFTVREDEPLEKEVAVDPEMLGKVFENLLEVKDRKSKGAFYTPREIVHYMCQQSLIQYLNTKLEGKVDISDIEFLVRYGDVYSELQDKVVDTKSYESKVPDQLTRIKPYAEQIDNALANVKVFDPAIGSGAFPVGMMHEIIRTRQTLLDSGFIKADRKHTIYEYKRQIIRDSIYGVDIEESAVEIAKLRLWLSLVVDEDNTTNIKPLPNLDYKIVCGNSLKDVHNLFGESVRKELADLQSKQFDSFGSKKAKYTKQINNIYDKIFKSGEFDLKLYFPDVFDDGGFDIVVANPPYIGEKGNKNIFQEIKQCSLGKFYQKKMDYFYFFFHLAINLVKEHGTVAFITTNYYITASSARILRTDFCNRTEVLYLINFNELKIFKSALGQHNMITIIKKNTNKEESVNCKITLTSHNGVATPNLLQKILYTQDEKTVYSSIVQQDLYDGKEKYIRLQGMQDNDCLASILYKIQYNNSLLGNISDVNQGLRTGADKVTEKHIISTGLSTLKKGEGIFILNKEELSKYQLNEFEKTKIKDLYKNSDIDKYKTNSSTKYRLIDIFYPNDKNIDVTTIPNIFKHLQKYKQILENRSENANGIDKAIKRGEYYFASVRRKLNFEVAKIVAPQRSKYNIFGYNEIPWYASADVYFITAAKSGWNLKYILSLLNSKLYYFWLYYKGKRKGDTLELYQKPLSEVPIKYTENQEDYIKLIDTIISKKQNNENTDNEEEQLNQMIYKLYDLTPEEIAEVERLYPANV